MSIIKIHAALIC